MKGTVRWLTYDVERSEDFNIETRTNNDRVGFYQYSQNPQLPAILEFCFEANDNPRADARLPGID